MTTETLVGASRAVKTSPRLLGLVMALFFSFGFCTVLVDSLTPKFKAAFQLNYAEAMLTQFCFFGAYFVFSLPAAWIVIRLGFLQGATLGLGLMAVGWFLFAPAAAAGTYAGFLAALFILAAGVTFVQVAANPLATNAGDPEKAHARLTLAQAFNASATMIGPWFGAHFILRSGLGAPDPRTLSAAALTAARQAELEVVRLPAMMIGSALVAIALLCWLLRGWAQRPGPAASHSGGALGLLARPRLGLGTLSIFVYVGAEVYIGNVMVNYLMSAHTISAKVETAGLMVSIYWGLAMVGRFIGAWALRRVRPGFALAACAVGAIALAGTSALSSGALAAAAILAVGLCNSIMFPTIFALAVEGLGERTARASGLLSMAIVGGALIPLLAGHVADLTALNVALIVPAACYAWIAVYGVAAATGMVDRWGSTRA